MAGAIVEVTGTMNTDPFLESFLSMYNDNPSFRNGLLVALMSAFVSKANGHPNPKFSVDVVNFYIALEATSRKAFGLVSGCLLGPCLRSIQRHNALSRVEMFIVCDDDNIKERLAASLVKYNDPMKPMIISLGFDGTKVPSNLSLSTSHGAILGGAAPNHNISVKTLTTEEVKAMIGPKSEIVRAEEMKMTVVSLQHPGRGRTAFFVLVGQPHTTNESTKFNEQVMNACVDLSNTTPSMDVISVAADGVGCDNRWVVLQMRRFL